MVIKYVFMLDFHVQQVVVYYCLFLSWCLFLLLFLFVVVVVVVVVLVVVRDSDVGTDCSV